MSLQKRANFSDCGPISACATDTPILVEIDRTLLSSMHSDYDVCRSDCRLCAGMCGKWLRNQGNSAYVFWPVDLLTLWQATWDMKNILYIWFSHFTLTKTHRCLNYSLTLYFNKRFTVLTAHAGLAIRQPCSITRDIVVNWQQNLSNSSSHTQ